MKEYVKILVTDDEPVMRNLLLRILETEGYQVSLASNAAEALEKLQEGKFDILLSDVKMPGLSGIELLREVKSKIPDMAVIMMTSYGEAFTVKEALMNGADEYITKPFKSHEISLIIERAYWRLLCVRNFDKTAERILIDDHSSQ
jgi:two-component system response regulator PilR (NtrC family)